MPVPYGAWPDEVRETIERLAAAPSGEMDEPT